MTLRAGPADRIPRELLQFGVVNLDKPPGPSSHQVSAWMKDIADVEKAAHAGTLDPKVTGCLPVLLGDATRLASALLGGKEYVVVLKLHGAAPTDLERVLATFEGRIYQKPPRKSAVKRELRVRTIHAIDVLETEERRVLLRIACESGTYIRKLCHDLGLALGTGAHMGDLRRTATTPFDDVSLVSLQEFVDAVSFWEERDDSAALRGVVSPAERALSHLPAITIAPSAAREVVNGAPVYAPGIIATEVEDVGRVVACYTPDGSVVCIGRLVGDPAASRGKVVDLDRVLM